VPYCSSFASDTFRSHQNAAQLRGFPAAEDVRVTLRRPEYAVGADEVLQAAAHRGVHLVSGKVFRTKRSATTGSPLLSLSAG
jgi:hypothetical protein